MAPLMVTNTIQIHPLQRRSRGHKKWLDKCSQKLRRKTLNITHELVNKLKLITKILHGKCSEKHTVGVCDETKYQSWNGLKFTLCYVIYLPVEVNVRLLFRCAVDNWQFRIHRNTTPPDNSTSEIIHIYWTTSRLASISHSQLYSSREKFYGGSAYWALELSYGLGRHFQHACGGRS